MVSDQVPIDNYPVVSHDEWLAARRALLEQEKAFTRQCDDMSRLQRGLPWERVTKRYSFDGPNGTGTLSRLVRTDGASSSSITSCSIQTTRPDARTVPCARTASRHRPPPESTRRHDGRGVARAVPKLAEYRKRMGWTFKWVSSGGSDFNFESQASFTPEEMAAQRALYNFTMRDPQAREREGHSIFYKDPSGAVFTNPATTGTTSSICTTTISISCRKDETKAAVARSGCAGTTNTVDRRARRPLTSEPERQLFFFARRDADSEGHQREVQLTETGNSTCRSSNPLRKARVFSC